MNLSEKLWGLMDSEGITRAELSKRTGLPYTTIDSILKRNDFEKIKLSTIKTLKNYFNVSLEYLLNDDVIDKEYGRAAQLNLSEVDLLKKYQLLNTEGKQKLDTDLDDLLLIPKYRKD